MLSTSMNRATIENGEPYNKLKRPDDFLTPNASSAHHNGETTTSRSAEPAKRTREEADISDGEAEDEPNKRSRVQNGPIKFGRKSYRPQNTEIGMSSMFPGMLDEGDLSDDATNEALAYLRSVRNEASTIPNLLVAPRDPDEDTLDRSIYENGCGDYSIIYSEGTWIARDPTPEQDSQGDWTDGSSDMDPQESYYRRLLQRYQSMRQMLSDIKPSPPFSSSSKPSANSRIATMLPTSRHQWLYTLDREYPSPSLLRKMTSTDILMGLRFCTDSLDRFKAITKQKSCWVWALLARAPEKGSLGYRESGCIRDLGRKAGQFGMRLRREAGGKLEREAGGKLEKEAGGKLEKEAGGKLEREAEGKYEDTDKEEGEWDATETDVLEDGVSSAVPESSTPKQEKMNGATEQKQEHHSQSDREMSISEDEVEIQGEDTTTLDPACVHLLEQVNGTRPVAEIEKPPPPVADQAEASATTGSDDEPTTLEEARARLLAQLGDRLVQPHINGNTSAGKPFASRADAERHRRESARAQGKDIAEVTGTTHRDRNEPVVAPEIQQRPGPDLNSRVTIDMILTVVAECYGQRDLLRFREIWE